MSSVEQVPGGQGLALWSGEVLPDWTDYNGHMTEHRYLQVFGESTDKFLERVGLDFERASEGTYYTLESHIRHLQECRPGTRLATRTEVLGFDEKRLHLFHRLFASEMDRLLATGEHLCLHVARSKACNARPDMLDRIAAIFESQSGIAVPKRSGSVLAKPLRHSRLAATSADR